MPPVLHVAFDELAPGAAQELLAQQLRLGVHERHRVLQLVAEAERSARLVVAAARPEAAGDRLVEQPAVDEHVERRVGRAHLHGTERRVASGARTAVERVGRRGRAAEALHQLLGLVGAAAHAEAEHDRVRLAVQQRDGHLDRRARIERGAHAVRRAARAPSAVGRCIEPLRPMNSARSQVKLPAARRSSSTSKKPIQSP